MARAWEEAFFGAMVPAETRKVALRIGMVLANEEDTVFDVLRKLTARGLGGAMGGGGAAGQLDPHGGFPAGGGIRGERSRFLSGTVNVTAPEFPTNREWMKIFRESVGMPIGLPASRWMLEIGARLMGHRDRTGAEKPLGGAAAAARRRLPLALGAGGGRGGGSRRRRRGLQGFFRAAAGRSAGAKVWLPAATR